MGTFLFKKNIDQSLLKAGLTIPNKYQQALLEGLDITLSRGEKCIIKINIANQSYDATLTSVNFGEKYSTRTTLQIRYAEGSPLCNALKTIFHFSREQIASSIVAKEGKAKISVEEEYLDVVIAGKNTLEFICHVKTPSALSEFLEYIGKENDLSGYQHSYRLVFYKVFFENATNGAITTQELAKKFHEFYLRRYQQGKIPDVDVDKIIAKPEKSSISAILNLILRNPFHVINKKGYFQRMQISGEDCFCLSNELKAELSPSAVSDVLQLIDKKLAYYYSTIERDDMQTGKMREVIERFLNEYMEARQKPFAGSPFGNFVRVGIPAAIYDTGIVDSDTYAIAGSVGQGNWAMIPWICIFDRSITTSATKGVYIVYLLARDGKSLYLTFNQGCTDIRKTHSKKKTIAIMRDKAEKIVSQVDNRGFASDENIYLGDDLTELGELYQKGTIFYKKYEQGKIPSERELQQDLSNMVDIYRDYVAGLQKASQHAWLLAWNPSNWEWSDFSNAVKTTQGGTPYIEIWTCVNTHVQINDRVFLMLLGNGDHNGMIASGYAVTGSYETDHWDPAKAAEGIKRKAIKVSFDWIIDYEKEPILEKQKLEQWFPKQHWSPQGSGIEINAEYIDGLEEEWLKIRTPLGGENEVTTKDQIAAIKTYIAAKGFHYPDGLIENFYLSLKSKPFVILAGISGTGKTRLVRLFAEAIGATPECVGGNGRYKLVSVRPDWSDSSDLFGHVNLKGEFVSGVIIDFVKRASLDLNHPYFLCLDEMNLARVEYYLSDFLSVIETRHRAGNEIVTDEIILDKSAEKKYGKVIFPENLYVIGTVNMDETTFPFSKKVLDRANTIEFSHVDLVPDFSPCVESVGVKPKANDFLKTEYITLATDAPEDLQGFIIGLCEELQDINHTLQKAQAHVGYRVRDEIVFYMINNQKANLLSDAEAMDHEIMQKILPRIQGSSVSMKEMLCELFKKFAGDYTGFSQATISEQMQAYLDVKDCKYRKSAEKICYMMRRFEEDGFASYWL